MRDFDRVKLFSYFNFNPRLGVDFRESPHYTRKGTRPLILNSQTNIGKIFLYWMRIGLSIGRYFGVLFLPILNHPSSVSDCDVKSDLQLNGPSPKAAELGKLNSIFNS